tara:strand:+ start:3219 stop:3659 length:441 start_codon:yes stop_codon:yes gene_type:complete
MASVKKGRWWYHEKDCIDCGITIVLRADVFKKQDRCRGCAATKSKTKHGQSYSKKHNKNPSGLYVNWTKMKDRCNNPKHKYFKYYGGKGIKVCDGWTDFIKFESDMGNTWFKGATLDRIDSDKGYSVDNCRWLTRSDNLKARWGTL